MLYGTLFDMIKVFQILSWLIWAIMIISIFGYVFVALNEFSPSVESQEHLSVLIIALFVFTIIEVGITIVIRHFILIKPCKVGKRDAKSLKGLSIIFIVSIVLWILSESIAIYGVVLFFMTNRAIYLILFALIGASMMVYHSPRLKPFNRE